MTYFYLYSSLKMENYFIDDSKTPEHSKISDDNKISLYSYVNIYQKDDIYRKKNKENNYGKS